MIGGKSYVNLVKTYFSYLSSEYGFKLLEDKIRGNAFYSVEYTDGSKVVSISYENIEDYSTVIIFLLQTGQLPNYDNKEQTLHLEKLNTKAFSIVETDEIELNNLHFSKFKVASEIERDLLKAAKELRLCLRCFDKILAI